MKTILKKYTLKEKVNETHLAITYQAVEIDNKEKDFVTVITEESISSEVFLSGFETFLESFSTVDIPYATSIKEHGIHDDHVVIVQTYIDGQSLSEMLTDSDGLPETLVLDIAQQVGAYLESLHQVQLAHGSLNLDTIFLSSHESVQIRDAGLAYGMDLPLLLREGDLKITPYHAPELREGQELAPTMDFYALGVVLYKMLTGETLALDPEDCWPGNKRPGLSPEIDKLVAKCLHDNPSRRIQSAAEFLNGVEEARKGIQAGVGATKLGMEDVLVGHTLGGYKLIDRLGQGGMATVYKAYESNLDRYVAIKVLPQFFAKDPNFTNRFRREAKAVAKLNHPNILPIYNYGEKDDITYIAMQYVEGGTLKKEHGKVYEPSRAVRLLVPIARALAYAHQRGIIHRDIKPSNVLMTEDDWPLLADFGLAKMVEASQQLTGTGVGVVRRSTRRRNSSTTHAPCTDSRRSDGVVSGCG